MLPYPFVVFCHSIAEGQFCETRIRDLLSVEVRSARNFLIVHPPSIDSKVWMMRRKGKVQGTGRVVTTLKLCSAQHGQLIVNRQ